MSLQEKVGEDLRGGSFVFRVRVGEYEVEVGGSREEVLRTIEELPGLMASVYSAFEGLKSKAVATVSVKAGAAKEEQPAAQKYPKIVRTENCGEAVLRVLETDWGKWRPRRFEELKEALRANGLSFSGRVFAGVLLGLVRKGKVRRWKTDAGHVYILAEKEG
jgi:hypothetical protein